MIEMKGGDWKLQNVRFVDITFGQSWLMAKKPLLLWSFILNQGIPIQITKNSSRVHQHTILIVTLSGCCRL